MLSANRLEHKIRIAFISKTYYSSLSYKKSDIYDMNENAMGIFNLSKFGAVDI